MNTEHLRNGTAKIKWKYSKKNLSQCQSVQHQSHMVWPGIEPGPKPLHGPFTASWPKTPQYEQNFIRWGRSL